jgi:type I restriction enzyme S subunit
VTFPCMPLGEISVLQAGFGFPPELQGRTKGDYPFAKVGDISRCGRSSSSVLSDADHYVDTADLATLKAKVVPAGSVLFAKIGEAIRQNHRVLAGCELLIDNNAMAAIPSDKVDGRFLYHFLKTVDFYKLAPATTVPALRKSDLEKLLIPCPPLPEQCRIATILNQADALRAKRREALAQIDSLMQAIFMEMFGDPAHNSKKWRVLSFQDACETKLGKMLDARQQTGQNKRRYLRNANVQWFHIDLFDLLEMDFDADARRTFNLQKGDLLICEGGEPGRAAIWQGQLEDIYFQKALHRGRPKDGVAEPEYLVWLLWFLAHNGGLGDHISAATIAHLTGEKLKGMPIPVPPIALQKTFATRIQVVEALKTQHRAALTELDALFASLQHRAFQGAL